MRGERKMRKTIFGLLAFLTLVSACTTPYNAYNRIHVFDEMEYKYAVKKVYLPENNVTIAYNDMGSGDKTVIMIHGLGSYLRAWEQNIAEISQSARVIAIDLPGYGKSSKEPHSGMMTYYAGVINELVKELKLENVILAGHSMGGQISITASLLYPEMVKGLILVAPAGFEKFDKGQRQWFRDVMTLDGVRLTTADAIVTNLTSNFYRMPNQAEFMIKDRLAMRDAEDFIPYCYAVVQSVNGMVDEPVLKYLKDVKAPTLIVFGKHDNLIPNRFLNPGPTSDIAQVGHSLIPNSKLVIIPKGGHFVMFEKAETFNQEAIQFIKTLK